MAAVLAVFIVYTAIAGAGTPQIVASKVHRYAGQNVTLVGTVRSTSGDAHTARGMRLVLSDPNVRTGRVMVVYHGTVPDLYKVGRVVVVNGKLRGGTFVADDDSLSTKCPSKYAPAKKTA